MFASLLLSMILVAQTAADPVDATGSKDPWEGFNRGVYAVNLELDRYLFRPIAVTYRRLLPKWTRAGLHNALTNWDEPENVFNDLLQHRFSDAARASYRFGLNSTVGIFGLIDVAKTDGVIHQENSFALTLGRYGIGSGPYLFLPFAGPSSLRDLIGGGVDFFTNPLTYVQGIRSKTTEKAQTLASLVDKRADVDEDLHNLALTALDPYASLRSIYQQRIEAQIHGDVVSLEDSPDIPGAPEMPDVQKGTGGKGDNP